MDKDSAFRLLIAVNEQVDVILRGRALVTEVHQELDARAQAPFEQDWIYKEHSDVAPHEPRQKTLYGRTVTTRILHQEGAGLRDIRGGDLLYEIEGEKYVLIQYKQAKHGRVHADYPQLDELIDSCPPRCDAAYHGALWCGSWVGLIDGSAVSVLPACTAKSLFAGHGSVKASRFSRAMSKDAFGELFAKCYAGARLAFPPIGELINQSLTAQRVMFVVSEGVQPR